MLDARTIRRTAVAGGLGVVGYVTAWAAAGGWRAGYDPVTDSISELYALGAPPGPARLLAGALIVTGLLLLPFAAALHRGLPGRSRAGPVVCALGGVATAVLATVPCTAGCPGLGASPVDTAHVIIGGVAYAALVGTPLLFALRLWPHDPGLARTSAAIGAVAGLGLLARALGLGVPVTGALQRVFNTVADAWYVLAAAVVYRRSAKKSSSSAAQASA